ncbi:MAG: DegT/DnrJ/EryC1/StrS family aminotransferase [Deltaproteobacteria bacterium]|nr:DegT/DnrJ/EryC1/StrS family aminotransferase [Deltaproteobacteria bacterium]
MDNTIIPFLDLSRHHRPLESELSDVFLQHLRTGTFIGGGAVSDFEKAFAEFCKVRNCVGVANGTDALMLALRVLGIGTNDVVLLPAHSFIATAEAVSMLGAIPRFVDIDPETYNISAADLTQTDTTGVKAIVPVHLYGQPADMEKIIVFAKRYKLAVVEDCAQSHGATINQRPIGSFGDLAGFSFYPGKNLGAFGDAGAVVGNDDKLLQQIRCIANHGRGSHTDHIVAGVNSRLDAIQAAILTVKLKKLSLNNTKRAKVASWYNERFAGIDAIVTPKVQHNFTHVYHLYVVLVPERDRLREHLNTLGIQTGIHYAAPMHVQPAYKYLGYGPGSFPTAEHVTANCVSLPMFAELTEKEVDQITKAVIAFIKAGA